MSKYVSINPATGQQTGTWDCLPTADLRSVLRTAESAFATWRGTGFDERARLLRRVAALLREQKTEHGRLMAEEMGKPIRAGESEAEKCAWACDYYAEHAERFLADESADTDASRSYVAYRPLGPVLAVMPWNFPYWQVIRFAAPALMAGNTVLLKHAANVPGCGQRLERLFTEAGFPEGCFRNLFVTNRQVGTLIRSGTVRAVTLTGSTRAGKAVARQAGAALKKTVLELGGSDPYVVLEDADLDAAARTCVHSRLINSGQSCIAAKRFVVVDAVRDAFTEAVVEHMRAARMGDPLDGDTDVGPQAREDLRDDLHDQVRRSVEKGARCLLGGEVPEGPGWFYPPTVLADVKRGMPAFREELFGPVASILPARDRKHAIRIANATSFGLGAAVFTGDVEEGERIARDELEAGSCFVNAFVRSDPRLPFGGIKDSGYGRELGRQGILEFVNATTVWVA
ncbi:MAG: NAD-dependent succinate-semialdehyde dehydrogenase [Gemmatimonadetes bacterium]|nr:NAD-dependent succinate-semialdehyde dehydrogenase [Gemmatimonadota bacterium]